MNDRTKRCILIGFTLLAGAVGLSLGALEPRGDDPFPTPSAGLTIPAVSEEDRYEGNALELLREFAEVTGEYLFWTRETHGLLRMTHLGGDRELTIPPEEVYEVVETLLLFHRFALVDLRREEPRMLGIVSLDSAARQSLKATARYVREKDLSIYADHPAIMITTFVRLEHLDVRVLTNTLRSLTTDPNTTSLVPISEVGQLIVTGFGPWVLEQVRMLREMDEAAGAEPGESTEGK